MRLEFEAVLPGLWLQVAEIPGRVLNCKEAGAGGQGTPSGLTVDPRLAGRGREHEVVARKGRGLLPPGPGWAEAFWERAESVPPPMPQHRERPWAQQAHPGARPWGRQGFPGDQLLKIGPGNVCTSLRLPGLGEGQAGRSLRREPLWPPGSAVVSS